jgi:hypothetical protein
MATNLARCSISGISAPAQGTQERHRQRDWSQPYLCELRRRCMRDEVHGGLVPGEADLQRFNDGPFRASTHPRLLSSW